MAKLIQSNAEPLKILLVEDNPAHAELVFRSFENNRVANKIYHVADGEEALNFLFRREPYQNPETSPRPHVILLDLRLPKIDGLEVLKEIKNTKDIKRIPVVVLTTSQAEIDASKAYDYHANSYLVKPLDFENFNKLMEELQFYWLAWNYNPWS
jgi:CheY-like chemotaxis protein